MLLKSPIFSHNQVLLDLLGEVKLTEKPAQYCPSRLNSKTCATSFTTEVENLGNLASLRHQAISTQEKTGSPGLAATTKHTRKILSFCSKQNPRKGRDTQGLDSGPFLENKDCLIASCQMHHDGKSGKTDM